MELTEANLAVAGVFDRAAPTYGTVTRFFDDVARDLVAYTGVTRGGDVLDLGTGRGAAAFHAAELVGPFGRVTGLDVSAGMLRLAREHADARQVRNVEFLQGDAAVPRFPAARFDVVLASIVLFFLTDVQSAVGRYLTLLRPGGRLGFTTFVDRDAERWRPVEQALARFADRAPAAAPRRAVDPRGWSDSVAACLSAAGFVDVTTRERVYVSEFGDPESWWRWMESSGFRSAIEAVPADRRDEARAAAFAAVGSLREPSGVVRWCPVVRCTRAVRPPLS